jgi:hypothetical protein
MVTTNDHRLHLIKVQQRTMAVSMKHDTMAVRAPLVNLRSQIRRSLLKAEYGLLPLD